MQYVEAPIEDAIENFQYVTCPDKKSKCRDGQVCCKGQDGMYTCCPLPNGVCCKDVPGAPKNHCCQHATKCCALGCCPYPHGVCCDDPGGHCCPHGTQCDVEHRTCLQSQFLPILMGLPEFNNIDPPLALEKVHNLHVSS